MAYINTVDERYGGTFTSSSAGARDAPGGLSSPYALAEGYSFAAYGALPFNLVRDVDTYDLGILSRGRYSIQATGWNWDFGNSWFGFTPNVYVYTAGGVSLQSHQGQEKAEDKKFAHRQMLVRNEAFGIHRAV